MKSLKAKDLREQSLEDLEAMLTQCHVDLYHNRRDLVFRKVTDTSAIKARRHDIARIKGVITELQKGGATVAVKEKAPAKAAAPKKAAPKAAKKAPAEKAPAKKEAAPKKATTKKSEAKA